MNEQERLNDGLEKLKKETWYYMKNSLPQLEQMILNERQMILDEKGNIKTEKILSQSLTQNGYIKFHSGFMIQWGKVTEVLTTAKTITLPQSFKDMNYKVVANSLHNSNTNMYAIAVNKKNVSQFQLLANYTAQSTEAEYIAVGFSN